MTYLRLSVCLAILLLVPVNAQRQTSFMVYGHGLTSCGKWLATPSPDDTEMLQWVLGYVTAAGFQSANFWNALLDSSPEIANQAKTYCASNRGAALCQSQLVRNTDSSAISAWLNQHCKEHPLQDLEDAAKTLVDELGK